MRLSAATCLLASTAAAIGPAGPARPQGKPTRLDNFPWSDPFASSRIRKFDPACAAERTFAAKEYLLDDLTDPAPLGLYPWSEALRKLFAGREYPGSWDGWDPHGYDRNLLLMEYADVPLRVREWIEERERSADEGGAAEHAERGLFAVYEKPVDKDQRIYHVARPPSREMAAALRPLDKKRVVLFAPGALYNILPLWVAEGSDCEDTLADLSKYSAKLGDGAVVAWPTYTRANRGAKERDITFTVKAQVLKAKDGADKDDAEEDSGKEESSGKDEL